MSDSAYAALSSDLQVGTDNNAFYAVPKLLPMKVNRQLRGIAIGFALSAVITIMAFCLLTAGVSQGRDKSPARLDTVQNRISDEEKAAYRDFVAKYRSQGNIDEASLEQDPRLAIFAQNFRRILLHNEQPNVSYLLGVTQFADLTTDEFRLLVAGSRRVPELVNATLSKTYQASVKAVPSSVDWSQRGVVTAIKNQGSCGSCWSFSSTGALEGLYAIKTGKLVSLSEQQLVDCSTSFNNKGCKGGWMDFAFKYVQKFGIVSETSYPYVAVSQTCQLDSTSPSVFKIDGFSDVPPNDNLALKSAVAGQPVAVNVEAGEFAFQLYKSGVLDGECGTNTDHAVLAVGYGIDESSGKKYWKIKNSWGSDWGEAGYIRLLRTDSNGPGLCGVATAAAFPIWNNN